MLYMPNVSKIKFLRPLRSEYFGSQAMDIITPMKKAEPSKPIYDCGLQSISSLGTQLSKYSGSDVTGLYFCFGNYSKQISSWVHDFQVCTWS